MIVDRIVHGLVEQGCNEARRIRLVCGNIPYPSCAGYPRCFERLKVAREGCVLNVYHFMPRGGLRRLIRTFQEISGGKYQLILTKSASFRSRCSHTLGERTERGKIVLAKFIGKGGLRSLLAGTHYCILPSSRRKLPVTLLRTVDCQLPIVIDSVPTGGRVKLSTDYCFRANGVRRLTSELRRVVSKSFGRMRCSVRGCK